LLLQKQRLLRRLRLRRLRLPPPLNIPQNYHLLIQT